VYLCDYCGSWHSSMGSVESCHRTRERELAGDAGALSSRPFRQELRRKLYPKVGGTAPEELGTPSLFGDESLCRQLAGSQSHKIRQPRRLISRMKVKFATYFLILRYWWWALWKKRR
jgi:hypothetical protein